MYESYWQLERKPFDSSCDPRFYFPDESHQAALLKLRYAIENRRGGALLAGPSGSGKTLLIGMLRAMLGEAFAPFVHLVFPQMSSEHLLAYLAGELTGTADRTFSSSVPQCLRSIEHYLAENTEHGRHAVLVVDEAHLLGEATALEALRLLLNYELAGRHALTLLLVGQPAILPAMDRMAPLEERLGVKCLLRPLTPPEVAEYVNHRLKVAGAKRPLFEPAALEVLPRLTQGIPRRINRLCDLALLIGYAEERRSIDAAQLEAVHEELVTVAPE